MIIVLDNSVLSSITNLGILHKTISLFDEVYISVSILDEYEKKWKQNLPDKIQIVKIKHNMTISPSGLSDSDLDVLTLSINKSALLASDDRNLRQLAKNRNVQVTGSLGIIRELYLKGIIDTDEYYIEIVNSLTRDVYLSQDLIDWAFEVLKSLDKSSS